MEHLLETRGQGERSEKRGVGTAAVAQALAALTRGKLAAHRLHTVKTCITKAGMGETTEQPMEAISGVVDRMKRRIDRMVEGQPRRSTWAT